MINHVSIGGAWFSSRAFPPSQYRRIKYSFGYFAIFMNAAHHSASGSGVGGRMSHSRRVFTTATRTAAACTRYLNWHEKPNCAFSPLSLPSFWAPHGICHCEARARRAPQRDRARVSSWSAGTEENFVVELMYFYEWFMLRNAIKFMLNFPMAFFSASRPPETVTSTSATFFWVIV